MKKPIRDALGGPTSYLEKILGAKTPEEQRKLIFAGRKDDAQRWQRIINLTREHQHNLFEINQRSINWLLPMQPQKKVEVENG